MTTSRAGGKHLPPWGISRAEPIGSSKDPPLAKVAPLPQMWQLSFSLPCVNERKFASKLARLAVTEGLFYFLLHENNPSVSFADSSLCTREPSAAAGLRKAKAFWNHQPRWWFSLYKKSEWLSKRQPLIFFIF